MALLTFSDGIVKLDNKSLPGLISSQRVKASVRFDKQDLDGLSGKKKVPMGWSDADITITLDLTTEEDGSDCYEKLATLDKIFRTKDKDSVRVFDVNNKHLMARGVRQVVFSDLESSETNADDVIQITLQFTEYEPPITKNETAAAGITPNAVQKPDAANPKPDPSIMVDTR